MTPHDQLKLDLPLYALGALTPEEAEAIERHLAEGCDDCRAEIARWREVVGALPLGAAMEAPASLREKLLRRVGGAADASQAPTEEAVPRTGARVVALRRRRWPAVALAAAAALALAYGIGRELRWQGELHDQKELVAQLRSALNDASTSATQGRGELERVRALLAAREGDMASLRTVLSAAESSLALLQRPGLSLVRLKQTPDAAPADGHVLISPTGRALFYAFDLAPLPADKTYELWWITEKEGPVNAGLFRPDPSGLGQIETAVPLSAGAIKAAAVTVEPEGGVAKPTGPMVLLGNI